MDGRCITLNQRCDNLIKIREGTEQVVTLHGPGPLNFFIKSWLAIAKLKPHPFLFSLLLMLRKAFDNVKMTMLK